MQAIHYLFQQTIVDIPNLQENMLSEMETEKKYHRPAKIGQIQLNETLRESFRYLLTQSVQRKMGRQHLDAREPQSDCICSATCCDLQSQHIQGHCEAKGSDTCQLFCLKFHME